MRLLIALAACLSATLAFAQTAAPAPTSLSPKTAKIERMMELTNSQANVDQMTAQILKMLPSAVPPDASPEARAKFEEIQRKSIDLIKQQMSWQRMKSQYAKLYEDLFTAEELDGMIAFYESPAGRSMLKKMPELVQRSMMLGQAAFNEIIPELQRLQKEVHP
jgi:hypothetical protein